MQRYFKPTVIFLVASVAIGAAYDVWAVSHSYTWTISANLLQAARDWPVIPFVIGVLLGHVFFPNKAAT